MAEQDIKLHKTEYQPKESFLRVATACPEVAIGDVELNVERILALYNEAQSQDAQLVLFPEMSISGYTVGDLVQQQLLLNKSKDSLQVLAEATIESETAMVVGLPLLVVNGLYNCAAVIAKGRVHGIVPKINLPNYNEFYEGRWFKSGRGENTTVEINGTEVPFGTDMLFKVGNGVMGVEICEDLWVMQPPSGRLAEAGANLIVNPSASPEQVGKSDYRRELVAQQSGRLLLAYAYAGCDASESVTDIVMSGHQIIAENGHVLVEREALSLGHQLTLADVDLDHINNDRVNNPNVPNYPLPIIDCGVAATQSDTVRYFDPLPYVPKGPEAPRYLRSVLDMQAQALATRIVKTDRRKVYLGLSGGLDSTLTLIVAVYAAERLGVTPGDLIRTISMPAEASSEHTQSNAAKLSAALGIPHEVIPISELVYDQLESIGHDGQTQDITYENAQARIRTTTLFNKANLTDGAMMIGTGDLSEIALGWSTFNADDRSHYNVNASIPKTLVKHLVAYAAAQPQFAAAAEHLHSILETPISPELVKGDGEGVTQQTEEIIGPYELHDFFLYHFKRWNDTPPKIAYMASKAFEGKYDEEEINKWLKVFLARFMGNQWKRQVFPDGPKIGSVSLSPRGDLRMPSEISDRLWLDTLQ